MKKLTAILLCFTMLFALVACGNSGDNSNANNSTNNNSTNNDSTNNDNSNNVDVNPVEKGGKLGAIRPSLSFDFQLQMNNGIQRAANEFGYEYQAYDYNFDNELMLSGLDTLKASDVKAMYAIFLAPESAASFMEENPEIGVLSQGGIAPGALAGTINDYVTLGKQFVDSLDNFVTENNITSGNIGGLWLEVCENQDSEYYQAMLDIKGQIEVWCEGKDFAFTADYYPKDDEEAANMTAQMLNADSDMKFIFAYVAYREGIDPCGICQICSHTHTPGSLYAGTNLNQFFYCSAHVPSYLQRNPSDFHLRAQNVFRLKT